MEKIKLETVEELVQHARKIKKIMDQVYICGYYAIVKFFNLSYRHPVFNLIDLGIIVIDAKEKHMVFGKNGKHLGDIEK